MHAVRFGRSGQTAQEKTDTGQTNVLVAALHRKTGHGCSHVDRVAVSGFIICVLYGKNLQADSESGQIPEIRCGDSHSKTGSLGQGTSGRPLFTYQVKA